METALHLLIGTSVTLTAIGVLMGLVFGIITLVRPNTQVSKRILPLTTLNFLEPCATLGLLFLSITLLETLDVLWWRLLPPSLSLTALLLVPLITPTPADRFNSNLLGVLRWVGTLRWGMTVLLWAVFILLNLDSAPFSALIMPMLLVLIGSCTLLFGFLWLHAALNPVKNNALSAQLPITNRTD
jgi:hypothetical protein